MNVGSIIKYYRTKRGLTQTELAEGICSTSHLSKIETNMYTANEDTLNMLLKRLNLRLEDEHSRMKELHDLLHDFIFSIFMHDGDRADILFNEIIQKHDYMETSDFVNLYHLYIYRYYCWKKSHDKVKETLKVIQRIKTTFTSVEKNIYVIFKAINASIDNDSEGAIRLITEFLQNPLPLGRFWIGEAYYLLSHSHSRLNQPEAGVMYGKKAYEIFEDDSNWMRIIYVQMILGINYMKLRLFSEANAIYEPLLRNTRLFFKDKFYPQTLINYARCLLQSKEYLRSKKMFEEALSVLPSGSDFYAVALLGWIEIGYRTHHTTKLWEEKIQELHDISLNLEGKFFFHYAVFYKKSQFSQVEGTKYAIKWLYPYLIKNSYYDEAREIVQEIIDYYSGENDIENAKHYYDQWRRLVEKERMYNEEAY